MFVQVHFEKKNMYVKPKPHVILQNGLSFNLLEGVAVAEWLSSWLAEQEVRGSIPGLASWISEIGYLLLQSRDMADIPLKRRES